MRAAGSASIGCWGAGGAHTHTGTPPHPAPGYGGGGAGAVPGPPSVPPRAPLGPLPVPLSPRGSGPPGEAFLGCGGRGWPRVSDPLRPPGGVACTLNYSGPQGSHPEIPLGWVCAGSLFFSSLRAGLLFICLLPQQVGLLGQEAGGGKMSSEAFCLAAQARFDSKWLKTDLQVRSGRPFRCFAGWAAGEVAC